MASIEDVVKSLENDAQDKSKEIKRLLALKEMFPDLKQQTGRWGKVTYSSAQVNSRVTDAETRFNCGCCNDSPFEVWPYMETELGRVHSYPAKFTIGERDYGYNVRLYFDWEDELRKHNIPDSLIERIRTYVREEFDDEDEYDDDDDE